MIRALMLIGLLLVSFFALTEAGWAAPPPGSDPSPEVHDWFLSLHNTDGIGCCSMADCRHTQIEPTANGGLEAWIGSDQFGPMAPNKWLPVPPQEIKSRPDRPAKVGGAIVCAYGYPMRVFCADLQGGI